MKVYSSEQRNVCFSFGVEHFQKIGTTLTHNLKHNVVIDQCLILVTGFVLSVDMKTERISGKGDDTSAGLENVLAFGVGVVSEE